MLESRDEIPLRGEGCNTPVLIAMLIMCLTANDGPKLIVSVNRVRVVKHCLAAFALVFLPNPNFESIFAQKQRCSSSCPLQLLF